VLHANEALGLLNQALEVLDRAGATRASTYVSMAIAVLETDPENDGGIEDLASVVSLKSDEQTD
jgi:hypothetical protein